MILFSYFKVALNSLAFWWFLHQILNLFKNTKCIFFLKKSNIGGRNTWIKEPLGENLYWGTGRLLVPRGNIACWWQATPSPRTGRWLRLMEHWLLGHKEVKGLVTDCPLLEHGHLSP